MQLDIDFACKVLAKKSWKIDLNLLDAYRDEVAIHAGLNSHDHVVGFWESFSDAQHAYIIMAYCAKGSLFDLQQRQKRPFTQFETQSYLRQILEGLNFIHGNRIVHCDLKTGNVLVNANGWARIGDFGAALRYDGHRANADEEMIVPIRGTVPYWAPESITRGAFSKKRMCGRWPLWLM